MIRGCGNSMKIHAFCFVQFNFKPRELSGHPLENSSDVICQAFVLAVGWFFSRVHQLDAIISSGRFPRCDFGSSLAIVGFASNHSSNNNCANARKFEVEMNMSKVELLGADAGEEIGMQMAVLFSTQVVVVMLILNTSLFCMDFKH